MPCKPIDITMDEHRRAEKREDLLWELECAIQDSVDEGRWARTAAERVLEIMDKHKRERAKEIREYVG